MSIGHQRVNQLRSKLQVLGVDLDEFLNDPEQDFDWWEDEIADTPAGFTELLWSVVKWLNFKKSIRIKAQDLRGQIANE